MKKSLTHIILATFIVTLVFIFSASLFTKPVSAAGSLCQLVETLISAGLISPAKAEAARLAAGCPVPPVVSTSTAPVATIIGEPTINLIYDDLRGGESMLKANFKISITATDGDVRIPLNPFVVGLINTTSNNNSGVRSARTVTTAINGVDQETINGEDWYVISEGVTGTFAISFSVQPKELFAGAYFARLYGAWMHDFQKSMEINPVENSTDKVVITGEVSPYITDIQATNATGTVAVKVSGVRLSDSIIFIDGTERDLNNVYRKGDTEIYFTVPLTAGYHYFYLLNSKTGASNTIGFNVTGTNQPSITVLSPNGGETLVQGDQHSNKYSISWNGNGLSGVYAFLVPANSDGYGSGSLGVIGYVSSNYSVLGWDGRTVWTDLNNGKEVNVPTGSYKIYLVGDVANVSGKVVRDMSDSYFKIVSEVPPVCTPTFTRDLTIGSTGADVTALQNFLGVTPATGYFGSILKAAVLAYQNANGISPSGFVGPVMRALLNSRICIDVQPSITPVESTINSGESIKFNLTYPKNTTNASISFTCPSGVTSGTNPEVCNGKYVNVTSNNDWTIHLFNSTSQVQTVNVAYSVSYPDSTSNSKGQVTTLSAKVKVKPAVSVQPSITVISPNGGENLIQGTIHTIKWSDNGPKPVCPEYVGGVVSPVCVGNYYDIYISPVCTENICPTLYIEPTVIASKVLGNSYQWKVKDLVKPSSFGGYKIKVCLTGESGICDSSDNYFKIVSAPTQPINGSCGTAMNSCKAGTFSDLVDDNNYYMWVCNGVNGGVAEPCRTAKSINPIAICGSTINTCNVGTLKDVTDNSSQYLWSCGPLSGGLYASCSIPKPILPRLTCETHTYSNWSTCTNNQQTRTVVSSSPVGCVGGTPQVLSKACTNISTTSPVEVINGVCGAGLNTCSAGSLKDVGDSSTTAWWHCVGINGGTEKTCSEAKVVIPVTPINGLCGPELNTCAAGTLLDVGNSSTTAWWHCLGIDGGAKKVCSKPIPVPPPTTTTSMNDGENYATAAVGWETILRLIQAVW